jgi:hypothetical protein
MTQRPVKLPLPALVDAEVAVAHANLAVGKDIRPMINTRRVLVPQAKVDKQTCITLRYYSHDKLK